MVDSKKDVIATSILVLINFICYVDRYSVAGVLTKVQHFYDIDDATAGAIQTVFLGFYVVFSPIFGYFGDRYNRKNQVIIGLVVWLIGVIGASFIPENSFYLFITFRGVIGVSEAIFSSINPTLVSDMFSVKYRDIVFMSLFIAVPVGCGVGFALCPLAAEHTGSFQWAIRIPGIMGILFFVPGIFLLYEPVRGEADGAVKEVEVESTYFNDLKVLITTPTYVVTTLAYTAMTFGTGCINWWTVSLLEHSKAAELHLNSTKLLKDSAKTDIGFAYGGLSVAGGLLGIATGTLFARCLLNGYFFSLSTLKGRQYVCAIGAAITAPSFVGLLYFSRSSFIWSMVFILLIQIFFTFYLALTPDILTTIVLAKRRTTAFAFATLLAHLLGDASGPLLIGVVSDLIRGGSSNPESQYNSLSSALYIGVAVLLLSGVLYFASSLTLVKDKKRMFKEMHPEVNSKRSDPMSKSMYPDPVPVQEYSSSLSNLSDVTFAE